MTKRIADWARLNPVKAGVIVFLILLFIGTTLYLKNTGQSLIG